MDMALVELVADLPEVSGDHHEVSEGEADHYVAITVPRREEERKSKHRCSDPTVWTLDSVCV